MRARTAGFWMRSELWRLRTARSEAFSSADTVAAPSRSALAIATTSAAFCRAKAVQAALIVRQVSDQRGFVELDPLRAGAAELGDHVALRPVTMRTPLRGRFAGEPLLEDLAGNRAEERERDSRR